MRNLNISNPASMEMHLRNLIFSSCMIYSVVGFWYVQGLNLDANGEFMMQISRNPMLLGSFNQYIMHRPLGREHVYPYVLLKECTRNGYVLYFLIISGIIYE
jgi:hypothetical protein